MNSPTWKTNPSYRPFDPFAHLDHDPLGRGYNVLRAKINQSAYDSGAAAATYTLRAEVITAGGAWGTTYTYYWRIIVPPTWKSLGASSYCIVGQLHEVTGKAGAHYPAFSLAIRDSTLYLQQGLDSNYPGITDLLSLAVTPGQEIELFAKVKWADGLPSDADPSTYGHVAAADGIFEITFNGVLTYVANGVLNTWKPSALHSDDTSPAMTAGIYQPTEAATWWVGKEFAMCHAAMVVGDSAETAESLRTHVNAQLAVNSNRLIVATY